MVVSVDQIRGPGGVDALWMSSVLQSSLGTTARVLGVTSTAIGTGQVGANVRFELTWDDNDDQLPPSVVGKFPSTSDISRKTAVELDTYTKEVGFYRDLQPQVSIRTPRVHHVGWDPDSHDFVIVMEDISSAVQGDQLIGCSVAQAEAVVDQAVGLHAPTWGRTSELAAHDWLGRSTDESVQFRIHLFTMLTPGFVARYTGRLSVDDLELTETMTADFAPWHETTARWADTHDAWCVSHGDYRLDNMLFGTSPASPSVTVVDWQTVGIGTGTADVAYFCGAGLVPEVRAEHERALVERYASGLRDAGVRLTDDAAWGGYVLGSASGLYMAVLASQIVERTDRGDEMFAVMAERHLAQIRSVGLLDVLGIG